LRFGLETRYFIDLAAERLIAAERGSEKIAVEVKSFLETSKTHDFHNALGQYLNYRVALQLKFPEHKLYLAVPNDVFNDFMRREIVQITLRTYQVHLIAFDANNEELIYAESD
jgi:sugar/nucleoside kinase (ribokinase family)